MKARRAKGVGITNQIISFLNEVFFGPYYFQVAVMLRSSQLLNSILLNSESWYNLTSSDIQELESVDNMLLRQILESGKSTPVSILHLELGTIPIRFVIKSRRLMFLQYILKQDKDSLLHKFFSTQSNYPQRGDWVLQIIQDLNEVNLNLTFSEISEMSKYAFKSLVNKAIKQLAFNWLLSEKNRPRSSTLPKGSELNYNQLRLQDYLLPNSMKIKQCKLLFSLRARMVHVRCNFKNSYADLTCPICKDPTHQDTQFHILQCKQLLENENILVGNKIPYSDLFSKDVKKQSVVTLIFEKLLEKRRKMEK